MSEGGARIGLRPRELPPEHRRWIGDEGPPPGVRFLPAPLPGRGLPAAGLALFGGVGLALLGNAALEQLAARAGLPTTAERLTLGPCLAVLVLLAAIWPARALARAQAAHRDAPRGRWREGLYLGADALLWVEGGACHLLPRGAVVDARFVLPTGKGSARRTPRLVYTDPRGRLQSLDLPEPDLVATLEAWRRAGPGPAP